MVEAKLLRKKLKNGLIVDKWDLVIIIEKQQAEIEALKAKTLTDEEITAIVNDLTCTPDKNWNVLFAKAILKKASEK